VEKYIKCLECKKLFKYLTWKHLKQHNLTPKKYRKKYPNSKFISDYSLEKMKYYQQKNNPMKGKKNLQRAMLNKLQFGKDHSNYGKSLSEKTRKKISETKKRLFREGKIKHPWIGRKHTKKSKEKNKIKHKKENLSKETLEKMRKSHKGKNSHRKGIKLEEEYGCKKANEIRKKHSASKKGMYGGEKNPKWNNGIKNHKGYIYIYSPDHPGNNQGYVPEHRLVMEKNIGRYLKQEEEIHHLNGIKNDNQINNLIL